MVFDTGPYGPLYTAEQTRRLDQRAVDVHGITGIVLMKRAGRAVFDALAAQWPAARAIDVVCGKGNNAGDGYVVAGLARSRGWGVTLTQLGPAGALRGDAARVRDWAVEQGVEIHECEAAEVPARALRFSGDLIVDALLGTGLKGDVRPAYAAAIEAVNAAGLPVIAVDVPSGLCPDRGVALGTAVAAAMTVTFIGAKRGLFTGQGRELAGRIVFDGLDLPSGLGAGERGLAGLRWADLQGALPPRPVNAHKGRFGHVLVVGGEHGMGGAPAMASEAALRAGAGLVSVCTRPEHVSALLTRRPELMVRGIDADADLEPLLERASVVAVGPGLGREAWGLALLERCIARGKPLVIDADGLNLVAEHAPPLPPAAILTPHPGEAARLLGTDTKAVQRDRFDAARALAERYRATVLLKGAGTVLADPGDNGRPAEPLGICLDGNPGMATAGMGDVLTGLVAGLWAQGLAQPRAAAAAACLHAATADRLAAAHGLRGMLATDLFTALGETVNGC